MKTRIKDEFIIAARECIRNNEKQRLIKITLDIRTDRVIVPSHPDFIERRGFAAIKEFIDKHFETKYIPLIWNYARGNNLTPKHGVVVKDVNQYKSK